MIQAHNNKLNLSEIHLQMNIAKSHVHCFFLSNQIFQKFCTEHFLDKAYQKARLAQPFLIDTFTVPLHRPNGRQPAVRAVQRDCHWGLKNSSHWSCEPIMQWGIGQSQTIFTPTNHKAWCQSIGGHVSYPTDSPITTRLGLCSSLLFLWAIFEVVHPTLSPYWHHPVLCNYGQVLL